MVDERRFSDLPGTFHKNHRFAGTLSGEEPAEIGLLAPLDIWSR
jgi:hypothetical protein